MKLGEKIITGLKGNVILCLQYLVRFREFKDYNFAFKNNKIYTT